MTHFCVTIISFHRILLVSEWVCSLSFHTVRGPLYPFKAVCSGYLPFKRDFYDLLTRINTPSFGILPVFGKFLVLSSLSALLKHFALATCLCHFHSTVVVSMLFFGVSDPCKGHSLKLSPFSSRQNLLRFPLDAAAFAGVSPFCCLYALLSNSVVRLFCFPVPWAYSMYVLELFELVVFFWSNAPLVASSETLVLGRRFKVSCAIGHWSCLYFKAQF